MLTALIGGRCLRGEIDRKKTYLPVRKNKDTLRTLQEVFAE